jgi:hypothetical protein
VWHDSQTSKYHVCRLLAYACVQEVNVTELLLIIRSESVYAHIDLLMLLQMCSAQRRPTCLSLDTWVNFKARLDFGIFLFRVYSPRIYHRFPSSTVCLFKPCHFKGSCEIYPRVLVNLLITALKGNDILPPPGWKSLILFWCACRLTRSLIVIR